MTSEQKAALEKAMELQESGYVAAVAEDVSREGTTIRLSILAPSVESYPEEVKKFIQAFPPSEAATVQIQVERKEEAFAFFGEVRPGSGIVRRAGGGLGGPGGTLTCLLEASDQSVYLVAAGHVLSNYWRDVTPGANHAVRDPHGSIYLNREGRPGSNSRRFLGKTVFLSTPPKPRSVLGGADAHMDVGIIKLEGEFNLKQRTTCYGDFGEWPGKARDPMRNDPVMKCGSQEVHWTAAEVAHREDVWIYGPNQVLYELKDQCIIELPDRQKKSGSEPDLPQNPPETPFAVAGDSGAIVVHSDTKRPLGMIVAGSVLDARYVMTPFPRIQEFWISKGFTLRRA